MYWTPAKMLLLADVDEYYFANAVIIIYQGWFLGLSPANEKCRCKVTPSFIDWALT